MRSSSNKRLKVLTGKNYPYQKNIDLGQQNVKFTRRTLSFPASISPSAGCFTISEPNYDLIHTVNCIPLFSACPYVITVESFLPRLWPNGSLSKQFFEYLRRQLLSAKCAKILAMSQFAIRMMTLQNQNYPGWPAIAKKIEVFYPSVTVKNTPPKKILDNKIRLIGVGRDFMRKGLPSIVRAHNKLERLGINVETNIISGLRWSKSDFIGPPSEELFSNEVKLLKHSSIKLHLSLPNAETISLMAQSHFLLLPTFHDTFGYVSIEALSVGTPVLATAVCAQPEIVSDKVNGFLIPMATDPEVGRWIWFGRTHDPQYTDAYIEQVETAAENIVNTIVNIADNTDSYEALSFNAIETARTKFNRDIQRQRLEALYEEIVGKN